MESMCCTRMARAGVFGRNGPQPPHCHSTVRLPSTPPHSRMLSPIRHPRLVICHMICRCPFLRGACAWLGLTGHAALRLLICVHSVYVLCMYNVCATRVQAVSMCTLRTSVAGLNGRVEGNRAVRLLAEASGTIRAFVRGALPHVSAFAGAGKQDFTFCAIADGLSARLFHEQGSVSPPLPLPTSPYLPPSLLPSFPPSLLPSLPPFF